MDRIPLPPPFPVGTKVRYIGSRRVYADEAMTKPIIEPGMIFEIIDTRPGHRGTLDQAFDGDVSLFDDDDEPILDTTVDGYSIYIGVSGMPRLINNAMLNEWEAVNG